MPPEGRQFYRHTQRHTDIDSDGRHEAGQVQAAKERKNELGQDKGCNQVQPHTGQEVECLHNLPSVGAVGQQCFFTPHESLLDQ